MPSTEQLAHRDGGVELLTGVFVRFSIALLFTLVTGAVGESAESSSGASNCNEQENNRKEIKINYARRKTSRR